ncbi:MAG: type II secretion system minor pseudopilin GspK [Pseudomonadota bacterium]
MMCVRCCCAQRARETETGGALLIVLLLVATLAFVALSIMERTSLAAARAANDRARAETLWRGFGAEILALAAIQAAYEASPEKVSIDDPWASEPVVVPMEDGGARIFFADATACFNVNSLSANNESIALAKREFALLAAHLGLGEFEGEAMADVIADWIDDDNAREPQGAEDSYYTALPTPYRTGGALIADVSEMRAMRGMTRERYLTLKPFLCAHPVAAPSPVNINMMRPDDAPVLAAALGRDISLTAALDLINTRPPGGYRELASFWDQAPLQNFAFEGPTRERIKLISQFVRARAEVGYDTSFLELTTMIEVSAGGAARIVRRRIGASE